MDCSKCDAPAVMQADYSGAQLCESHFLSSVEQRVRRRIRKDGLIDNPTPESPTRWIIGLSGGKDSVVLTQILHDTFADDPRIELIALSIHEGIEGYRDESLAACRDLTEELDIRLEVVSYDEEHGVRMDDVVASDEHDMAPCAYCGVFRRDILDRYADQFEADILLTGHNLDDEAQTAMMNLLEGDVLQMAKHYDASLAPMGDRSNAPFIPRAKPLRDIPEKEVGLYATLRELPAHMVECPHASEAFRGEIQNVIHSLEEQHPGTRHSILSGYEELAALAAEQHRTDQSATFNECIHCESPTTQDVCRACELRKAMQVG